MDFSHPGYAPKIVYVVGTHNVAANALSRICNKRKDKSDSDLLVAVARLCEPSHDLKLAFAKLREHQDKDPRLATYLRDICAGHTVRDY